VIPPQLGVNLEMKRSGTGIQIIAGEGKALLVYPNPTDGIVHIVTIENILQIKVISLAGSVVTVIENPAGKVIDISHLPQGIYILLFETPNGEKRARVVKK
jgi:hypothetical protein